MIKSITRALYIDGKSIVLDERGLREINAWDDEGFAEDSKTEQLTAKEIRERFEKVKREMGLG